MKKTFLKKLFASVLAATMVLSVAGCGQEEKPANSSDAVKESSEVKESVAEVSEEKPEEKPDPVTVKWVVGGSVVDTFAPALEKVNELLVERYNLVLDMEVYDFGTYNDKMNMKINAGDEWDLAYTSQNWLNKYVTNVQKGAFLKLDDYLADYPGITEAIPDFIMSAMVEQGGIYAVPNYQAFASSHGVAVQTSVIDEMKADGIDFDLEKVEVLEDLYPYLEYVKENHNEMYPLRSGVTTLARVNPDNPNRFANCNNGIYYDTVTEKAVWAPLVYSKEEQVEQKFGEWYEGITNRTLLEKGYYRKDAATVTDDTAEYAVGRYASFVGPMSVDSVAKLPGEIGGAEVAVKIVSVVGPLLPGRDAMTCVNSKSENPEAALKMLEVVNTDTEIFNMLVYGIEGADYNLVDGQVEKIEGKGTGLSAFMLGNTFNALTEVGQPKDINEQMQALSNSAVGHPLTGFTFDSTNVAEELNAITAVASEFANWYYERDYEKRYDDYVEKIKEPMTVVVDEWNKQIDAWKAANGK